MRTLTTDVLPSPHTLGTQFEPALSRLGRTSLAFSKLVLLSPFLLAAGVMMRLQTAESAIYRKTRTNAAGKPFQLYQLRTMSEERDSRGVLLPAYKRVNELGRWLYATRLYKAPGLWNIVIGDINCLEEQAIEIPTAVPARF